MRRYICCAAMLLVIFGHRVQAQYSDYYYHRVGDTIEWKANNGFYSWWEFEPYYENNLILYILYDANSMLTAPYIFWGGSIDSTIILQKFYTPTPLKIVGVAGIAYRGRPHDNGNPRIPLGPDTNSVKEYFFVYDADSNAFTLKAQVPWSPFDPKRTLHIRRHAGSCHGWGEVVDSCCLYCPENLYLDIHEHYFNSAFYVTDSFYVGGSLFGNHNVTDSITTCYEVTSMWAPNNIVCDPRYQTINLSYCSPIGITLKLKEEHGGFSPDTTTFSTRPWRWNNDCRGSLLIYPIIEVDTTLPPTDICEPISNVQVTTSGTTATVTWDDYPYYSRVLLRYGLRGHPQSLWREVVVTGNTLYFLDSLAPTSYYGVSLKAECDTSKQETPWSATAYFFTGVDTTVNDTTGGGGVGIGGETALSRLIFLQPNPAQDEIRVESSFSLRTIEIWTLDGVLVYHGGAVGHETTVDVSYLRAGTYIVAIHTYNGTTHKKLLITR